MARSGVYRARSVNSKKTGRPKQRKNGVTKIKRASYCGTGDTKSEAWRTQRLAVLERDGFRCTKCGRHKSELDWEECLQVDHIKQVSRGGTDRLSNLRTLCYPKCHGSLYLHDHIKKKQAKKRIKKLYG